jgi:ABC-type transport system substrate-binding protein
MSVQQSTDMKKSNPEITQIQIPAPLALSIDPRNDTKPFNDVNVRMALQMAINLPDIAKNYYLGACDPNPALMISEFMKGYSFPYAQWPQSLKDQYTYNPTKAKQLLAAAGYPNGFNTEVVIDSGYDMNLIQIVKSNFADIGINLTITTMDPASWTNFVLTQKKYTQLASSSTGGKLGRVVEPLVALPAFNTGDTANYMMITDPAYDAIVTKAIASTTVDQAMQLLQAANQEMATQHFVVSLLIPMTFDFVQPWLQGYIGQDDALSGRFGPSFLGFYGARFWIDQNMKKSMGH